mgnify:CR=1 FL=1
MANIVPFRSLSKANEKLGALKSSVRALREKTKKQVAVVARTGEVALAAGAAGLMNGYFNSPQIGPVPLDVGIGALIKGAGFLMDDDDTAEHVQSIGDGFIAAFVVRSAMDMGLKASADQNRTTPEEILSRRALGQNDDGTAAGAEGDHPGADAPYSAP